MDGTLTHETSSWETLFRLYDHDPSPTYRLYEEGLIDQDEWAAANLREIIRERPGLTAAEVERALVSSTHLRSGIAESVSELSSMGARCVIISAGIEPLARWIGSRARFHEWRANWFEVDAVGCLVPKYIRNVSFLEKESWLRSWMSMYGISREEVVAVGDSCNDVSMFQTAGHSIAFNPTDGCAAAMGEVVHHGDDLRPCVRTIKEWMER